MSKPIVAIIGKPNVGKSTFFNYLAGSRISIVQDTPGVTRDRIYGHATYKNYAFDLVDTGGIELDNEGFNNEIKMQAELAIDASDVIIFVVDGKEGITNTDLRIRDMLMKFRKTIIVAINKTDSKLGEQNAYDFYELGFENYVNVSGEQHMGIYDLLDLVKRIKKETKKGIWIYSGYTYEEIMAHPKTRAILSYCDVLVDGPFIESLKSLNLRFKGSSNQRIIDIQASLENKKVCLLESY